MIMNKQTTPKKNAGGQATKTAKVQKSGPKTQKQQTVLRAPSKVSEKDLARMRVQGAIQAQAIAHALSRNHISSNALQPPVKSKIIRPVPSSGPERLNFMSRKVLQHPSLSPKERQGILKTMHLAKSKNVGRKRAREPKETDWWAKGIDGLMSIVPKLIPLIFGAGDYDVTSNSIMAAGTHAIGGEVQGDVEVPSFGNDAALGVPVRHREYLGDLLSTTANYTHQELSINPGLYPVFPWASSVATAFQQYRLKGMCFEFKSLATDYSAQPYIGFVAMGTQYDISDTIPSSKLELEALQFATSKKTNESFLHPIECAPRFTPVTELRVRNGPVPANFDPGLFDIGRTSIAIGGQSVSGQVIGELWNTYDIEFYKPRLSQGTGQDVLWGYGVQSSYTNSLPAGNGTLSVGGSLPINFSSTTVGLGDGKTPVLGTWDIYLFWVGSAGATTFSLTVTGSGCTALLANYAPALAGSQIFLQASARVVVSNITVANPSVVLSGASLPTGGGAGTGLVVYVHQEQPPPFLNGPVISVDYRHGKERPPLYVPGTKDSVHVIEDDVFLTEIFDDCSDDDDDDSDDDSLDDSLRRRRRSRDPRPKLGYKESPESYHNRLADWMKRRRDRRRRRRENLVETPLVTDESTPTPVEKDCHPPDDFKKIRKFLDSQGVKYVIDSTGRPAF